MTKTNQKTTIGDILSFIFFGMCLIQMGFIFYYLNNDGTILIQEYSPIGIALSIFIIAPLFYFLLKNLNIVSQIISLIIASLDLGQLISYKIFGDFYKGDGFTIEFKKQVSTQETLINVILVLIIGVGLIPYIYKKYQIKMLIKKIFYKISKKTLKLLRKTI